MAPSFDLNTKPEDYVHRIGRTGRAQAAGCAYTLVTPTDESMVRRIEMVMRQKIQRRRLDGIDYHVSAFVQPDADAIRRYVEANRRNKDIKRSKSPSAPNKNWARA